VLDSEYVVVVVVVVVVFASLGVSEFVGCYGKYGSSSRYLYLKF
jgi:hypothetical protein